MYALRNILSRSFYRSKISDIKLANAIALITSKYQSQTLKCFSPSVCYSFGSKHNDRFDDPDFADVPNESKGWSQRHRPNRALNPFHQSRKYQRQYRDPYEEEFSDFESTQSTPKSHRSFDSFSRRGRHQRNYRDPYDDEEDDVSDLEWTRRREPSKAGANLSDKEWGDSLPPIEKNFYVESPSVTQKSEEQVNEFYTSHNISITKGERPLPISEFTEANFPERINEKLVKTGWHKPTPIQSLGWPLALSGKNLVAIAQTGSGKTLGFILPALIHIKHQQQVNRGEGPVVLVMAPTRELAQQIQSVTATFGRVLGIRCCAVFGGQSKNMQARHLNDGPEIVIATPGRLLDFLESDVVNLDRTSYVVLDEADRMLDMGFEPQIRKVLGQIRPDRQMLMWSATWPREIQQLAKDFLGEFTQVNIGSTELRANPNITQVVKVCERREKFGLLVSQLDESTINDTEPVKTLIFAQTKFQADQITHKLRKLRLRALSIHGDKSQLVRDRTLASFRQGQTDILVATDVASRGLDVNDIKLVINYDYPNNTDDYIHRIGRTARAEKTGTALTFITEDDSGKLDGLIDVLKEANQDVPQELVDIARLKRKGPVHKKSFNNRPSTHYHRRPYSSSDFSRRSRW